MRITVSNNNLPALGDTVYNARTSYIVGVEVLFYVRNTNIIWYKLFVRDNVGEAHKVICRRLHPPFDAFHTTEASALTDRQDRLDAKIAAKTAQKTDIENQITVLQTERDNL